MKTYGVAWIATAAAFLALDAVWLSLAASRLYKPLLGGLLREPFQLTPAVLFYLIFTTGIVVFAVAPSLDSPRWTNAALRGAFFGFVGYAVYDLTNQATLNGWPVTITVADLIWGTALTAVAATAGYFAARAVSP